MITASSTVAPSKVPSLGGSQEPLTHLDALLGLPASELSDLYAGAAVPRLDEVRGDLRGRMLTTTVLHGAASDFARRWASSRYFPWRGKSFSPRGATAGEGINRVVQDRFRLYRFETSIGPSRAGDFDALHLDYDLPENPSFIRAVEDEIRALTPELWLGQAYLRVGGQRLLVLYFGLAA